MNRRHLLGFSALALTLGPSVLWAQDSKKPFTPEQLDQLLAPIALYPDALLSQTLMAATYPLEVVEAARWTQANPNLKGDAAVQAVKTKDWDVSVKSLVAFPQTLGDDEQQPRLDPEARRRDDRPAEGRGRFHPAPARQGRGGRQPQDDAAAEGHDADVGIATAPSSSSRPIPK